jgi:hypothetical protein
VFGNERGKLVFEDAEDQEREKWLQFVHRQAGRKAALKAVARIQAMQGK